MDQIPDEIITANRVREAAKIGYSAFLEACDEDTRAEWVDGEVVFMSPVSLRHARIGQFLGSLIERYLEIHPIGELFRDSVQMKTGPNLGGRLPDLLFVRTERASQLMPTYIDGPADLVVEVVSLDSRRRDLIDKRKEYADGGVTEYWIVDSIEDRATFCVLKHSAYEAVNLDDDGYYSCLVLPGLRINPDWLWQEPLPKIRSIKRLAGVDTD